MRPISALLVAGTTAVVVGCSAPAPYETEARWQPVRPALPALSDGRAAFDNRSLRPSSTDGRSANVSVAGQLRRPPAAGATLGAPGPGPVQLALVDAYLGAVRGAPPACRLRAELLAAIGHVESGSAGGQALNGNRVVPGIYGPLLSGGDVAAVADTDGGLLDGDTQWDRALGPMQIIPSTWAAFGTDGDGDGRADPQNLYDAAVSAALYLCAGGRDLSQPTELTAAILSYNHSGTYLLVVLDWIEYFGTHGLVAIGPVSVPVLMEGPAAPKKTDRTTVTAEVVRKAVAKAAELPVAPPPPQPTTPVRRPSSPTPSAGRPTSSTTTPAPSTTDPEPDPTTTSQPPPPDPDPTTTSEPPPPLPDPTTTTVEPPPLPDPTTTVDLPPLPDPTTTVEPPPLPDPTTTVEPPPLPDPTTTSEPPPPEPDPTTAG